MDNKIKQLQNNPTKYLKSITTTELVKLLKYLSNSYYNKNTNVVSDELYDFMIEYLQDIDPSNEYLNTIGADIPNKKSVVLPFPMGSLNKVKPNKGLSEWISLFNGPYIISDKLDGISVQLYKNEKGVIKLFSRGNGLEGRDISGLIKYIFSNDLLNDIPNNLSVRGELIMSKNGFKNFSDEFKNARNLVAGVANSDKHNKKILQHVDFIAYNILHPVYIYSEQLTKLKEYGFTVVNYTNIKSNELENILIDYYINRRNESKYEIDGIVLVDNSKIYKLAEKNPDYSVAFKMNLDDQIATATIINIKWNISMYGYFTPVVIINPVNILGVTITNITAHNAKYVYDNKIGKGAIIKIIRSGDVIPYILEVVTPAKKPDMPKYKYKWNDTNVDILVDEMNDEIEREITIQINIHFFKTINIKYISEGIIKKLYDANIKTIIDILSVDRNKLLTINGLGNTIINKIYKEIDKKMNDIHLYTLMAASTLFGHGLGIKKLKKIVNNHPKIMNENHESITLLEDKLLYIEGIGHINAKQFCTNFDKFKEFYNKIKNIYKIDNNNNNVIIGNKLKNISVVFTGFRDKDLEKKIENNGGNVKTSVSKNTNILIYKDESNIINNSKYKLATELGINILSLNDFINKYKL